MPKSGDFQINPTAASLLGFLESGPMTGWDLATHIDRSVGNFWNVTRSQVYRELAQLEAHGLVAGEEAGARARRPYHLTAAGRRAFRAWLNDEPGPDLIRSRLLLTVFFGEHLDPAKLRRFLTGHRLQHQRRLETYRELEGTLDESLRFPRETLAFGIAFEELSICWIESLERRLEATGDRSRPPA
jgi:DNA-binding PadR family transcriptional regulator